MYNSKLQYENTCTVAPNSAQLRAIPHSCVQSRTVRRNFPYKTEFRLETLIDMNISAGIKVTKLTRNRPPSWNCVSATESYIAAGTVEDKMVILWSAQTCEVVAALPGHTSYIINMDFSEVVG